MSRRTTNREAGRWSILCSFWEARGGSELDPVWTGSGRKGNVPGPYVARSTGTAHKDSESNHAPLYRSRRTVGSSTALVSARAACPERPPDPCARAPEGACAWVGPPRCTSSGCLRRRAPVQGRHRIVVRSTRRECVGPWVGVRGTGRFAHPPLPEAHACHSIVIPTSR